MDKSRIIKSQLEQSREHHGLGRNDVPSMTNIVTIMVYNRGVTSGQNREGRKRTQHEEVHRRQIMEGGPQGSKEKGASGNTKRWDKRGKIREMAINRQIREMAINRQIKEMAINRQ